MLDEQILELVRKHFPNIAEKALQEEIAYDLNASREAVSRLLKQLENDGLVKLGRNKIELN